MNNNRDDGIDAFNYAKYLDNIIGKPYVVAVDTEQLKKQAGTSITKHWFEEFVQGKWSNEIDFIIVNKIKNTTVCKLKNGTVGKVKCNGEKFDLEKGIAMAILKAYTKFKELNEILDYFDEKTASKIEKGIAIYLVKKKIGKDKFDKAVKEAKIIEKVEKEAK